MKAPPCFEDPEARKSIESICRTNRLDSRLLRELCEIVVRYSGSGRAEGITTDITQCIDGFVERTGTTVEA